MLGTRQHMQLLYRGAADTPPRRVQDALEGEIVRGLVYEPQIGERVADLLALVKARPADHAVGHSQGYEPLLEFAGLEAGAHEYRDLAQRVAFTLQRLDLFANPAGFFLGVPDGAHHDLVAFVRLGPQRLAEPPAVLRDHPRRCAQDVRGRAVVLFESGNRRPRKIRRETQNVADLGAAPAVDRLVVIADAAQITPLLGQQPQP